MASSLASAVSKIKSAISNATSGSNTGSSSSSKNTGTTSSVKQSPVAKKSSATTPTNATKKSILGATLGTGNTTTQTNTTTGTKTSAVTKKQPQSIVDSFKKMGSSIKTAYDNAQQIKDSSPYVKSVRVTPSGDTIIKRTQPTGVEGPLDVPKTDNTWKSSSGKTLAELEEDYKTKWRELDTFLGTSKKGIGGFFSGDNRTEKQLASAMDAARTAFEDAKKEKAFYDRAMGYKDYDTTALGKEWAELMGQSEYDDGNIETYDQLISSLKSKRDLINPGYAITASEYERQQSELAKIDEEIKYYEDLKKSAERTKSEKRDDASQGMAAIAAVTQASDYLTKKYGSGNKWEKYKELEAAVKTETDPDKRAVMTMDMALMKQGAEYDKYLYYDLAGAEQQLADIKTRQEELSDEVTMLNSDMSAIDSGRETESGLSSEQIRLRLNQIESEAAMMQEQTQAIRADMTGAKSVQKLDPYYHIPEADDFDKYVAEGEAIENDVDSVTARGLTTMKSRFAKLDNPAKYVREWFASGAEVPDEVATTYQSYNYMTPEEYQTYEYLLGKYGKARAEQYHLDMLEVLNSRQGAERAEALASANPAVQVLGAATLAGVTGAEQYVTGWQNTLRALQGKDQTDTSATQFMSANYREHLGDVGNPIFENGTTAAQMLYDSGVTMANMAPSILLGQAAGSIAGSLPKWAGAAIEKLGTATMGISAGGNYYAEAIRNGYSKEESAKYAAMAGASEAVLQDVLGGISHLGGIIPEGISNTVLANIDNSYLRMAAEIGVRDFGEGLEEYLQDVLTPVFYNLASGEKNTVQVFNNPDATYSFLMACLTTSLLEGGNVYQNTVQASKIGDMYSTFFTPQSELITNASEWEGEVGKLAEDIMYGDAPLNSTNLGKIIEEYAAKGEMDAVQKGIVESLVKSTPDMFAQIYSALENPNAFTLGDEATFVLNNTPGKDVDYSNQQVTLLTALTKLGKLTDAGWKKLDVTNPAIQQLFTQKTGAQFAPNMSEEEARHVFETTANEIQASKAKATAAVEQAAVDAEDVTNRIKNRRAVLENARKTASELISEPIETARAVAKTDAVKAKTPVEETAPATSEVAKETAPETKTEVPVTKKEAVKKKKKPAKKVEAEKAVAAEKAAGVAPVTEAPAKKAVTKKAVAKVDENTTPDWYNEPLGDLNDKVTYKNGRAVTRQQWIERGVNKLGKTVEEANAEFNSRMGTPATDKTEAVKAKSEPVTEAKATVEETKPAETKATVTETETKAPVAEETVTTAEEAPATTPEWYNESLGDLNDKLTYKNGNTVTRQEFIEKGMQRFGKTAEEASAQFNERLAKNQNNVPAATVGEAKAETSGAPEAAAGLTTPADTDTIIDTIPDAITPDIQTIIDKFNTDTSFPTNDELDRALEALLLNGAEMKDSPQHDLYDQILEESVLREQEADDAAQLLAEFKNDPGSLSEQDAVWLFDYALNHEGFDDVIDDLELNVRDWGYDNYVDRVKEEAQQRLSSLGRAEQIRSGDGGRDSLAVRGSVQQADVRPGSTGGVQTAQGTGATVGGGISQTGEGTRSGGLAVLKPGTKLVGDTYLPQGMKQLDEPAAKAAIGEQLYNSLKRTGLNIFAAEALCDEKGKRVPGVTILGPNGATIYVSTTHPQFSAAGIAIHEAVHRWMDRAFGTKHFAKSQEIARKVLLDAEVDKHTVMQLWNAYDRSYSTPYADIKQNNKALYDNMIWEEILGDMIGNVPFSSVGKLGLYNRGIGDLARNALRDNRVIEQAMTAAGIQNTTTNYYARERLSADRYNEQDLYGWTDEMLGSLYKAEEAEDGLSPFITDTERLLNNPNSKLQNVFNKLGEAKADVLASQLRKLIKPQEMLWTGLNYFLDEHKGQTVTRQDVLDYIAKNNIQIEQNTYQAPAKGTPTEFMDEDTGELYSDVDEAKDSIAYTLSSRPGVYGFDPGTVGDSIYGYDLYDTKTDNGSILIEVETKDGSIEPVVVISPLGAQGTARWGGPNPQGGYGNYALDGGDNYREYTYKYSNREDAPYTNQSMKLHFDDNDLLGHARVQDFTTPDGKKVLFVEEVQSDWASALRKNGVDTEQPKLMQLYEQINTIEEEASHLRNQAFGQNGKRTALVRGEEYVQNLKDQYYEMMRQVSDIESQIEKEKLASRGYQIVPYIDGYQVLNRKGEVVNTKEVSENGELVDGLPIYGNTPTDAAHAAVIFEELGDPAPNMPFGGDYYQFVMKDLLKKAVDGGYDYIAWATPEMQSERYYDGKDVKAKQYQEYKYDFRTPAELAEAGEKKQQAGPIQSFLAKYSNANRWRSDFSTIPLEGAKPDPGHKMNITEVPAMAISEGMKQSLNENPQPLFKPEDIEAAASVGLDLDEAFPEGSFERTLLEMMRSGNTEAAEAYVNSIINSPATYTEAPAKSENLPVTDEELATLREAQEEKIKRYGKLKPGEKAARDIRIAEKQNDGTFTRRHAAHVAEAEAVPEHTARALEKFIASDEAASYVRITDKEATNYADNLVKKMGIEKAMKMWDGLSSPMHNPTKKDIALGETLALWAAHNGRDDLAMKIWADIDVMATNAGQVVQSMRLVKKMSPEYQAYYVRKVVDQLNHNYAKQIEKGWKGMTEITINEELEDAVLNASTKEELDTAMDALLTDLARQVPASAKEKWDSWRYFAMLGNPRTHVRNILGNALFAPLILGKNLIAKVGEDVAVATGAMQNEQRTKSFANRGKYKDFAEADFKQMEGEITGERDKYTNPRDAIMAKRPTWKLTPMEKATTFVGNALNAEDTWFLKPYYTNALSSFLAARNADVADLQTTPEGRKLLNEARKYAVNEAQKATYRDASVVAQALNKMKNVPGLGLFLNGVLPFTGTPVNILRRGLEYSPIGLLKTLTYNTNQLSKGDITPAQYIDNLASGMTGTMVAALGLWLANSGLLRGVNDDDDKKKADFDKNQGHQDYAIEFEKDGKKYSYTVDWMAPTSLPLFVGVALHDLMAKDNKMTYGDWIQALSVIVDPMTNLSMLDGLNKTLSSLSYAEDGEMLSTLLQEMGTSYIGQAIPTFWGQIARTFDGTRRSSYADKNSDVPQWIQYFIQSSVQNKIPVWEGEKMAYVDLWGRKDTEESMMLRAFENFISPGYLNELTTTPVDDELMKLYEATGESSILPSKSSKYFSVAGERKDLTAQEFEQLCVEAGSTKFDMLGELFNDQRYADAPEAVKLQMVEDIYKYANAVAKFHLDDGYNIHNQGVWIETAEASDNPYESIMDNRYKKHMDDFQKGGGELPAAATTGETSEAAPAEVAAPAAPVAPAQEKEQSALAQEISGRFSAFSSALDSAKAKIDTAIANAPEPVHLTDKDIKAYNAHAKGAGVSEADYLKVLTESDKDGNSSLKQEELGSYLNKQVREGKMSEAQASAVWDSYSSSKKDPWKTSYTGWKGKSNNASKAIRYDEDEDDVENEELRHMEYEEYMAEHPESNATFDEWDDYLSRGFGEAPKTGDTAKLIPYATKALQDKFDAYLKSEGVQPYDTGYPNNLYPDINSWTGTLDEYKEEVERRKKFERDRMGFEELPTFPVEELYLAWQEDPDAKGMTFTDYLNLPENKEWMQEIAGGMSSPEWTPLTGSSQKYSSKKSTKAKRHGAPLNTTLRNATAITNALKRAGGR